MISITTVNKIEEKLKHLPSRPGVYLFKDNSGRIIYIGKAKVLRNRVRSYFQSSRSVDLKVVRMISRISDFEIIITDSEVEALILEANLVKQHRPRYNINLKDDKSYPYIRITNEAFPRIFPTRKIVKDGSKYFGPYTDVLSMKRLLNSAKKIFPIRACNLSLNDETIRQGKYRVCLNYHINKCLGPCEGHVSSADYHKMIESVENFIRGKSSKVVELLKDRMQKLAEERRFEVAANVRDQLESIEAFQNRQKIIDPAFAERDIVATALNRSDSCCVVFRMREGKIVGRQHFYMSGTAEEDLMSVTIAFVKQYYLKVDEIPDEIILPVSLGDECDSIRSWLTQKATRSVRLTVPKKGIKANILKMCRNNARLLLKELEIQKQQRWSKSKTLSALQKDLHLESTPNHIEAFDISNLQGKEAVASMVCFIDGKPKKSAYRRYKIRVKETPDDFAMMHEVVFRRFNRLVKGKQPLPDLILIDGGKGQLSAALAALNRLEVDNQPVAALAKRFDEVFVPGHSAPQNIRKDSPGLVLLQQIRDESHRFAIDFHRQRRNKSALVSELDTIPGIGEKRKKMLIKHFGSVENLKSAAPEDIKKVKGFAKIAQNVWEHLHDKKG
ncbi:excinuclease ABC subunit C [candidate division KSB1 bacterium]|nr:excinuclease ABC subunit C [candidate division KSB1 bacterium]